ncbi:PREDICTED: uncharacterized protein LOC105563638 [Vollenhovia emeryi]|uniref:uncharacterized protein LOC105563638 n=1 Tax=Vollenhovia emeryi TaxID=411798 RepID=UPI0005F3F7C7|nr:PREDICTED: uncharacterized protein LOC105563638 [Vollenhovia emeryi]
MEQNCWLWNHYTKLSTRAECKICRKTFDAYRGLYPLKAHLSYKHEIQNGEENYQWKSKVETRLIWEYFSKEDRYSARCNKCSGILAHAYKTSVLEKHLLTHSEIEASLRETITGTWLSKYFTVTECKAKCTWKDCKSAFKTYDPINVFKDHLRECHCVDENSGREERTGYENYEDGMMHQNSFAGPSWLS